MNLAQQGQKSTSRAPEIIWVATNPEQLILSKTYPTSGYNLAHISRHARLLTGGYFSEKRQKYFLTFNILALDSIQINSILIFV